MGHCSRADIEEFPLEGVRTIAGSIHKHYFGHLPPGLQRIDFGHNFNQSILEVDFPKSLQVLIFGNTFNQSLEHVVLPNNLQTLIFGRFGGSFRMKLYFCFFFGGGSIFLMASTSVTVLGILPHKSGQQKVCHHVFYPRWEHMPPMEEEDHVSSDVFFQGVTCVPCRES